MYQSMAVQRLMVRYDDSNLKKAAEMAGMAIPLARKTENNGLFFYAAYAFRNAGDFARAEAATVEGERMAAAYEPGFAREYQLEMAKEARAYLAYQRGDSVASVRLFNERKRRKDGHTRSHACSPLTPAAILRRDLEVLEGNMVKRTDIAFLCRTPAEAGVTALALKDWGAAKSHADQGIRAAAAGYKLYSTELQNVLVLRVAESRLRHAAAVGPLTARARDLARLVGLNEGSTGGRTCSDCGGWCRPPNSLSPKAAGRQSYQRQGHQSPRGRLRHPHYGPLAFEGNF